MLAKPEWFQKRKYTGWGVNPRTWQGWVYVASLILAVTTIQSLAFLSSTMKNILSVTLIAFFLMDTLQVMAKLDKDELEEKNEAMAERNAAWAMVLIITVGIIYQVASSRAENISEVDPFLLAALIAGFLVKAISYLVFEKK